MGLRQYLRRLVLPSEALHWGEPPSTVVSLRGEVATVRLFALAAFLAVLSIALMLPDTPGRAWAIGLVFGLGLALGLLFASKTWASVSIRADHIVRERHYGYHWVTYTWPYPSIERCIIVPLESSGKKFSVMILTTEDDIHVIGIPRKIDPRQVGQYVAARGVRVTYAQTVPKAAFSPHTYPPWLVRGTFVAAAALVLMGPILRLHPFGEPPAGPAQPGPIADRGRFPLPELPRANPAPADFPPRENPFGDRAEPLKIPGPAIGQGPGRLVPDRFGPRVRPGQPGFGPPGIPAVRRGRPTDLLGGSGGGPFETAGSGDPVLGFDYRLGSWAGQQAIGDLRPLFARAGQGAQPLFARGPQAAQQVMARDGYAVGALEVDAAEFVNAVRVVFMRVDAQGRLDRNDSYKSDWIGAASGRPTQTLGGDGSKIIGIYGRRTAVLDAIGLILE